MGFYAKQIFPRVMDWVMAGPQFQEQRQQVLADVRGDVLEIGFGTGLNLPFYPKTVSWLTVLDPANLLPDRVVKRLAAASVPVQLMHRSAEVLPFASGRFDFVVSTWTLCTIPDVLGALREARRVLKGAGMFVFLEHGRSEEVNVAKWQDRLDPIQRVIACGCHLNRRIDALIEQAGFELTRLDRFVMSGVPRLGADMYRGAATPNQ
jgi:SAM-dependent methyltransferase